MSSLHRHPVAETELLLHADGELRGELSGRVGSHVADCKDCRTLLADREAALRALAEFRNYQNSLPEYRLPDRWEPLDSRMDAWENQRRIGFLPGWLRGVSGFRYGLAGTAALILVAGICFLAFWQDTVSANMLLRRASLAQGERLRTVAGRTLHCTLLIRRRSATPGE